MKFDQAWLNQYQAKHEKQPVAQSGSSGVDKESTLHAEILNHCKRVGWIAFHGSMAHQTFRTEGEFDFTILADSGRVFLIECKTRTGKLSPEQAAIHHWARKLGHVPHVVRSMSEFLDIIK